MQFGLKFAIIFFILYGIPSLKAEEEFSSEEIKNTVLTQKVDSIKNQLKDIKSQVTDKYQNEKLLWQLEVLEKWYQAEDKNKCSEDLSFVFSDWKIIQKRLDGSENFYRNWSDYKQGFGDKNKEYFIGLESLHQLSKTKGPLELLIILGDHDKNLTYAKYDHFEVGSEEEQYELKELGTYTGTAGDALSEQVGKKFTTVDRDNDNSKLHNCAKLWRSAWWFGYCHQR